MKKIVIFDIDEEALRAETNDTDTAVNELIRQEFGWLRGVSLEQMDDYYAPDDTDEGTKCEDDYDLKCDLVNRVINQLDSDIHNDCRDSIKSMLINVPTFGLLAYLPQDDEYQSMNFKLIY